MITLGILASVIVLLCGFSRMAAAQRVLSGAYAGYEGSHLG
jgi:hypothetical protein